MALKIDPEFRDLIPPLSTEEYVSLEKSILEEGCREAIILWNNFIIDGHNRYSICSKHNLPFRTVEKQFETKNDVCIWMIQNQFARRNLTNFVRGELGLKLDVFFKKKAEENLKKSAELTNIKVGKITGSENSTNPSEEKIQSIDVREEVAKAAGVSSFTISQIKRIKQLAPVEIKDSLETKLRSESSDKISINQAVKFVEALKEAPEIARGQIGKHVLEQYNNNPKISLETATQAAIKEHLIKEAEENIFKISYCFYFFDLSINEIISSKTLSTLYNFSLTILYKSAYDS